MIGLEALFDVVVVLLLVVAAIQSLHTPSLFTSVAFFVSYGLVMALAWVRLEAPDVALAEAAVGAGLTGVLLIDAARERAARRGERVRQTVVWAGAVPMLAIVGILIAAVLGLPRQAAGLAPAVADALRETGVEHGVTAVLLAFRAFDTWLEMAVLLLAIVTILVLQRSQHFRIMPREMEPSPVLGGLLRILTPVVVVFGGYLLWIGTREPGGAFQAGVLIGAAAILLELADIRTVSRLSARALIALLVAGVAGFVLVSGALLSSGAPPFAYPEGWSSVLIVGLEILIALSVAVTVVSLMVAANLRLEHAERR